MIRRESAKKIEVPVAKSDWHPSPLLGQIVLITSRSTRGEVHVAAKSWISMVASTPPTLSLACRISHRTAINILETREFVVNVPGDDVSSKVWNAAETLQAALDGDPQSWSFQPAAKVSPPLIEECRAHIECILDSSRRFNDEEIVLYGRILAVSVDEKLLQGETDERYGQLRPLLFLEEGVYGVLETARRVEGRDEQA
jgi:flavin reductase (DIM6/NTAB) family NADH-FMN oxidoreductase RutF